MGRMPIRDRLRLRTYNNLPGSNDQGESPDQEFIQGSSLDHEQEIPPAEHQIQQSNEDEMEQDHNDIEIDRTPPQTDDEVVNYVQILSQEGGVRYLDYIMASALSIDNMNRRNGWLHVMTNSNHYKNVKFTIL
uniref:Uncharacterized protein n=1 Tax=Moniliophthora roreri TaxID=221103 RepID=A0A0W0FDD9_MONRR